MVTVLQGNRKQTNHREPGNATQVSNTNQWGFIIVNQGKYFKPPIGQYIIYVTHRQSKYVYMTLVVGSISYNYCSKNEYIQHGRVYMGVSCIHFPCRYLFSPQSRVSQSEQILFASLHANSTYSYGNSRTPP